MYEVHQPAQSPVINYIIYSIAEVQLPVFLRIDKGLEFIGQKKAVLNRKHEVYNKQSKERGIMTPLSF